MSLYIEGYWEYAPGCPAIFDFISKSEDPKVATEQALLQYPGATITRLSRITENE